MTKEKNTTTKTAEPMSIKTVVNPVADKPKKTNTHGIKNLNISRKKESKPAMYQLMKNGGKDSRGKIIYPVVYMVKAEDIIYDPEKDINRKIRYIPGEVSIFEDEQKDDAKVKSPITFSNGFLMVDKTNPTLRKYLDMCNANYSNPNRSTYSAAAFKLLNSEEKAKKNIDKMMVGFMGGMNDPKTELKEILLKANEYRIISLSKSSVSWIKGDQRPVITHVPLGVKAIDHMAEYCMSGKGESVLEHIKLQLERLEG